MLPWWNIFITVVFTVLSGVVSLIYILQKNFDYWNKRNVPHKRPTLFFGTNKDYFMGKANIGEMTRKHYESWPDAKVVGSFHSLHPVLVIRDPDLIKAVLVKDFASFRNRDKPFNYKNEPLLQNLFHLVNEPWRILRQKLTPSFSSLKMKNMFPLITASADDLKTYISEQLQKDDVFEVRELMRKFTKDVIGSCAFGIDVKALSNETTPFSNIEKLIFQDKYVRIIRTYFRLLFPNLANILNVRIFGREIENFITGIVSQIVRERDNKVSARNDMIDLMIEMKNRGKILSNTNPKSDSSNTDLEVTLELMAAQAFVFFSAGFETSSTATAFTLYELAMNPDVQNRLYDEIQETLSQSGGVITYEMINDMDYLDRVFDETLRKYPSLTNLNRVCNVPYTFPGTNVTIDRKCSIVIPVYALHRDPKYFPDPDKFDPERFTPEAKKNRHPFVYLAFGDGPRNCIGGRFGKVQSMIGIATVVRNFKLEVCDKTPRKIVMNAMRSTLVHQGSICVKFVPR